MEFSLDKLHETRGLITSDSPQTSIGAEKFKELFSQQNAQIDWTKDVRDKTVRAIRHVILSAITKEYKPPAVLLHYPQSRYVFVSSGSFGEI